MVSIRPKKKHIDLLRRGYVAGYQNCLKQVREGYRELNITEINEQAASVFPDVCPNCSGTGKVNCPACDGLGCYR